MYIVHACSNFVACTKNNEDTCDVMSLLFQYTSMRKVFIQQHNLYLSLENYLYK